MNIFIVGCNLSVDRVEMAPGIFKSVTSEIPNMDPSTYWHHRNGSFYAATMHHSHTVSAPRSYLQATEQGAVFFDGSIFDPVSKSIVDDASWLEKKWDALPGRVEGQFAAVKMQFQPAAVELFNDHIGLYRVYLCSCGDGFLISNSIGLLTRLRGNFSLDAATISMKVAHGHTMGESTLQQGIRSFIGGAHWKWTPDSVSPRYRRYFNRTQWSRLPKRVKDPMRVKAMVGEMVLPLRKMAQRYGVLESPLTAGRDSRVIFAMLQASGVPSQYFSVGDPVLADVQIGSQIAEHYQVEHRLRRLDDPHLIENWEKLVGQVIRTTDGTVPIVKVANIFNRQSVERLGVMLYGACGEYARNQQINSFYYYNRLTLSGLQRHQISAYEKSLNVLARKESMELSRHIVCDQIRELAHEGFAMDDILLAHYMFNRSPHLAGCMSRLLQPYFDVYCPYCTPAFAKAAFTEPLMNRYGDRLHYQIIATLLPELHQLPIQYPWHLRHPIKMAINMLRKDIQAYLAARKDSKSTTAKKTKIRRQTIRWRRGQWLKSVIGRHRAFCLDQQNSLLWDWIDRDAFDRVTRANSDPTPLWRYQDEIFDAITLFEYAHGSRL